MSAFEEQNLKKLEAALSALTPRPAHLDRDGLLFEAGRRSVRPSLVWPLATLALGLVSCLLTMALIFRPDPPTQTHWIPAPQPSTPIPITAPNPAPQNLAFEPDTRLAAARAQSVNNLKELVQEMHNYYGISQSFPPPAILDKQEKPLLSWRVHLLPWIEQAALHKEFKLDEPWDSEHNKKLIPRMPQLYKSPLAGNVAAGKTVYLAAAGPGMVFEGPKGMTIPKITDGTSNTIMLVEANDEHAVTWTQPDDYKPDRKNPAAPLLRNELKGFHVAMSDGSVRMLSRDVSADSLWRLLTAAGGEVIEEKKDGK